MELKDVVEGNKLIATFMGLKNISEDLGGWFDIPNYHLRWDYLMPVVEKIENLDIKITVSIGRNLFALGKKPKFYCSIHDDGSAIHFEDDSTIKIEIVWKMVVQFITWFNSTTLNPLK